MQQNSNIARRHFLRSMLVAGVAPTFVPAHVLGKDAQTAPSDKISLGIIGVGAQGVHDMKNFLELDNVRVTAICDVNKHHIERARKIISEKYGSADVKVYSDFRDMNRDPSIDAVQMTLPVHWHSIPATDAILNGKHIYHEKPMAMSFAEAAHVRDAVRKKNVVFQFGTQQRSDLKFRWACELARNGRIGKLKEIKVAVPGGKQSDLLSEQPVSDYVDWNRWVGPAAITPFHTNKLQRDWHENISNFSLGMISCWGIHHLDIAQWGNDTDATGPSSVEGSGRFPANGTCDAILDWNVRLEYAKAAPITFVGHGRASVHFIGDAGSVYVNRQEIKAPNDLLRDPVNKYGTMPIKLPVSINHMKDFIAAITSGRRSISDIETAVRGDTLCQLALIAVKSGRKHQWDPATERFVNDDAANAMLQAKPFRGDWALPPL
jgi:predicted dehydrogenase